ncbi:MAG TPA: primary-amine oxidase [Solirubrobacteraceae bacterium]|nr:primary-amine oxidase [Solirubrobacteraceae bacterium]
MSHAPVITQHPLSPLTADELRAGAAAALEGADGARVVSCARREPDKGVYLAWREGSGDAPAREALVVLARRDGIEEVVVDLAGGGVSSREPVPGARPPITPEDYEDAAACVLSDPRMVQTLRARGVEDLELVQIDVLPSGSFGHPLEAGHRFGRAVAYLKRDPLDNAYARPIEHLIAFVDLDAHRVLEIEEGEPRPIPQADGDYRAGVVPAREDLRPFSVTQPEGVSFVVEGGEVRWHRWTFVPSIDPQEGLVLHDVRYDGRPVLHRGSCPEMIVPYGEPDPMHNWRTYFDAGEYGLGSSINSLELGCDCLGEITYLDAWLSDHRGEPQRIANAICLHEEDAGILWKHTDHATGHVETRRGRRFVVNAMATVGNYEYAFRWYLGLDGTIEVEVQLHGIVSTIAAGPDHPPRGSNLIDDGLAAPHHQHLFCFRLDLDVDGTANSVSEVQAGSVPSGPENPLGNAFVPVVTPLRSESEARRQADDGAARVWTVSSGRMGSHGRPTAYRLVPGHGTATLLAQPDSSVARRAGFAAHTLWVTPYRASERFPAGAYPYGRAEPDGLPVWSTDRPLEGEDIVLWYTIGVTHFVRPEDWPIMPMTKAGFRLEPVGFFDRNPTLDIPASGQGCHHGAAHNGHAG